MAFVAGIRRIIFANLMSSLIKFFWISVKFYKCAIMDWRNGLISTLVSNIAASPDSPMWNSVILIS